MLYLERLQHENSQTGTGWWTLKKTFLQSMIPQKTFNKEPFLSIKSALWWEKVSLLNVSFKKCSLKVFFMVILWHRCKNKLKLKIKYHIPNVCILEINDAIIRGFHKRWTARSRYKIIKKWKVLQGRDNSQSPVSLGHCKNVAFVNLERSVFKMATIAWKWKMGVY